MLMFLHKFNVTSVVAGRKHGGAVPSGAGLVRTALLMGRLKEEVKLDADAARAG